MILRRWPTTATPRSLRSSTVSFGSTSPSIALSRNAASYCARPRLRSQSPTSIVVSPDSPGDDGRTRPCCPWRRIAMAAGRNKIALNQSSLYEWPLLARGLRRRLEGTSPVLSLLNAVAGPDSDAACYLPDQGELSPCYLLFRTLRRRARILTQQARILGFSCRLAAGFGPAPPCFSLLPGRNRAPEPSQSASSINFRAVRAGEGRCASCASWRRSRTPCRAQPWRACSSPRRSAA